MTDRRQPWPYAAAQARDDAADSLVSAARKLAAYIKKNKNQDPELLAVLLDLQLAQTFLITVGAQVKPERFL